MYHLNIENFIMLPIHKSVKIPYILGGRGIGEGIKIQNMGAPKGVKNNKREGLPRRNYT